MKTDPVICIYSNRRIGVGGTAAFWDSCCFSAGGFFVLVYTNVLAHCMFDLLLLCALAVTLLPLLTSEDKDGMPKTHGAGLYEGLLQSPTLDTGLYHRVPHVPKAQSMLLMQSYAHSNHGL